MDIIAICIVTYNHEQYIAQALDSVLAQKTEVPVKIFIGEDGSTDNTLNICKEYKIKYPDRIELLERKQNLGLVKNTLDIFSRIRRDGYKYIAMLDGDDYWIDENKLQKQYEYLEKNEDYGLIHTNCELRYGDRLERNAQLNPLQGDVFYRIEDFHVANCTVMFKTSLLEYIDFDEFESQGFFSCDYAMYAVFSKYTKYAFLDEFTAVWRRGHISISNTNSMGKDIAFIENDLRMWNYLGIKFPERFGHSQQEAEAWWNFRVFNIAFRYEDFSLANSILRLKNMQDRKTIMFRLKKIMATNKIFFFFWNKFKN